MILNMHMYLFLTLSCQSHYHSLCNPIRQRAFLQFSGGEGPSIAHSECALLNTVTILLENMDSQPNPRIFCPALCCQLPDNSPIPTTTAVLGVNLLWRAREVCLEKVLAQQGISPDSDPVFVPVRDVASHWNSF